jgi:site-specific recombinase XerD
MRRWDGLVNDHLEELTQRGLTEETVAGRARELDYFGNWLKRRRPRPKLEEVSSDHIVQYLHGRGAFKAKSTVSGILSDLRNMGEYLVRREIWASNPLRWMQGPKLYWYRQAPRRIGRAQMEALWETAATKRSGYHRYLWVAMLSMLYGTGLRRGELARLDVSAWNEAEGTLLIDGQKTGCQRQVRLPGLTAQCLSAYLPKRHNHLQRLKRLEHPALWINQRGERLTPFAISRGIQRLAHRSGMGPITLHQFRHSCASDLLEAGIHLPEIQRMLGHQSIMTTVRYLQVADPQRHAAAALHPINRMLGEPS